MIKNYKKTKLAKLTMALTGALCMLFAQNAKAFPGGTYTIDRTAAASATNYLSFTALANDLTNINRGDGGANNYAVGGAGVQATVTVNVVASTGPYTERFLLTQLTGVSATNRLIINGNGNTLQFAATSAEMAPIEFNGTDYVTINNLDLAQTAQSSIGGKCVWIYNSANFNTIKNCKMRFTFASTSQGSAYVWICNSTSTSPYTYADAGNSNLIDSCDMNSNTTNSTWGPYHGVVLIGNSTRSTGNNTNSNTISNSNIQSFHIYGIWAYYTGGLTIKNNTIHNTGLTRTNTKYGIYTYYTDFNIDKNRIYNMNGNTPSGNVQYGVYLYSFNSSGWVFNKSTYTNNVVHLFGTGTLYGSYFYIYGFNGHVLDIVHNTHSISHPTATNNSTNYAMYGGYWQGLFENNIMHIDIGGTTGTKQLMYDFNPQFANYRNNNWSFGPRTANFGTKYYGPGFNQGADMQAVYSLGVPTNNISFDPEFVDNSSNSIMIPTSIPMANKARVTTLTSDLLNVTRSSTPDIGAYEYTIDLAITNFPLTFPMPTCAGYETTISGRIKNNGLYTINRPRVAYRLNAMPQVEYSLPGSVAPGDSVDFSFPMPTKFSVAGPNTIVLKLAANDDMPSNDQMSINFTVTPAPGGATITKDMAASSVHAQFVTTGRPDITFPNEKMVYDFTAPSRVGYTSSQYGSLWNASVTAIKESDLSNASSLVNITAASGSNNMKVNFVADKTWENQTILISTRVTNLGTGCDTVYTRRIIVAPKADIAYVFPTVVCEKTDILFDNKSNVSSGSIEYTWDFGDGSPISDEASPVHLYAAYGTYTVTMTAKTNPYGFVSDSTFILNITEVPEALIINTNACENVAIRLRNGTVYGGSGSTTYVWDYGDNTGTTVNNRNDIFKTYASQGGYLVKLTATADGCSNSTQKFVYQFARPVASFTHDAGVCLNSEFSFTNTSTIANGLFGNEWDFNDAGNKATVKDPMYNFQSAGTKNVQLKVVSEFGCEATTSLPIVVKQIPTTDFTYPFACRRTATPFTNTTSLNGEILNTYAWDFGDGFTSSATSPIKNWTSIGPRLVKLTTTLINGCSSSVTKEVTVGVQPTVDFTVADQCAGKIANFANKTTYDQGKIKYTWSFGDGVKSNDAAPTYQYQTTSAQTFTVQLKAEVEGGCADSSSKTININPLPTTCDFTISGSPGSASTIEHSFVPNGTATGVSYIWLTGDGNSVTSNGSGASYRYNGPGKYCVKMIAKDANTGCECSETKCITLTTDITNAESMNNAVSVYPNPNSGVFNVSLDAVISGEMTVMVYNTIGELVKTIVVNGTSTVVDMSDVASGVYSVKVIADNQIATKKITITK